MIPVCLVSTFQAKKGTKTLIQAQTTRAYPGETKQSENRQTDITVKRENVAWCGRDVTRNLYTRSLDIY